MEREAGDLFAHHRHLVQDRLEALAGDDNPFAASLLAMVTDEPTEQQLLEAQAAAAALTAPLRNTATSIGIGIGAERRSLSARWLPEDERKELVRVQLDRVRSPYGPGINRAEYYLAATNLTHDLDDVDDLFAQAMEQAQNQTPSPGDLMNSIGSHPLGMFRTSGMTTDTRPHALLLAAHLARTEAQKRRVRDHAISLLGSTDSAGWYVVRALRVIALDDLVRDVPLLATQHDWAARSLEQSSGPTVAPQTPRSGHCRRTTAISARGVRLPTPCVTRRLHRRSSR